MNPAYKIIAHLVSIPARLKGMKFGRDSFIGPGYDIDPKLKGIILESDVIIGRGAWLDISLYTKNAKILIGDGTQIGRYVMISSAKNIKIGKKCLISHNVSILDHDHKFIKDRSPLESGITEAKEIAIGDNCFIGAHSFILKGVTLGKNCVVGANSVVAESFSDYSVIAGNPAKLIKSLE
jgi:carbonic anhydrase/acetyltransferase-like protein (isoleucine patch superfamily)